MIISVTQEHIDRAEAARGRGEHMASTSPIAQCLTEMGYPKVNVTPQAVSISTVVCWMSPLAVEYARKFSYREEVVPETFEVWGEAFDRWLEHKCIRPDKKRLAQLRNA